MVIAIELLEYNDVKALEIWEEDKNVLESEFEEASEVQAKKQTKSHDMHEKWKPDKEIFLL